MIDLIDTHQHLLYRNRLGYAWADGLPALAGRDFTLGDYSELIARLGVAGTIFMEADASSYTDEARMVAGLAADPASRIQGIIASCRPEEDGFAEWLDECAGLPVVGLRRILHEVSDDLSQSGRFRDNVAGLGARGLTFDMCFRADQLHLAVELAQSCPATSLVLDHCGVPDIAGGEFDLWAKRITAIAALPNVACKISGVLAYCAPGQATEDAVRPYVSHVIDSFGPDRLVWGSDWPVVNLGASLPDWIGVFRSLIADLSDDEQRAICSGNAQRIYGVTI